MRVITLVGRDGVVAVCDSKTKQGNITRRNNIGTSICLLKELEKEMVKLRYEKEPITILVPNLISVTAWDNALANCINTGKSSKGNKLTKDYIRHLANIAALKAECSHVKILSAKYVTNPFMCGQTRAAWKCLDKAAQKDQKITAQIVSGSTNF